MKLNFDYKHIFQFYINQDGKYHEFSLIHYISAKSLLECNPSCDLTIFTNKKFSSKWITLLQIEYPTRFSLAEIEEIINYDDYDCIAHAVDNLKLLIVDKYGGLVIDSDYICIKSIEWMWKYSTVIGKEYDPVSHHYLYLSIGFIYSDIQTKFILDWLDEYENYKKGMNWTYYSGEIPDKLIKSNDYPGIYLLDEDITSPFSYTRDATRDIFMHNKSIPPYSYMIHVSESITWDRYLKPLDIEHIMTVDTTFTKVARPFVKHLWK